jgi:hypothetical protein
VNIEMNAKSITHESPEKRKPDLEDSDNTEFTCGGEDDIESG